MSTAAEKLKAIQALFSKEKPKQKFNEITTEDGTILMIEGEMVTGAPIMVKTETGTEPAKAGEYKLADGSTVIVEEDGKLKEVKAAEVMAEENPEVAALKAKVAELEAAQKKASETATANAAATTEQMAAMRKALDMTLGLMEEFIKTPDTKADQFANTSKEQTTEKYAEMFAGIQTLKSTK